MIIRNLQVDAAGPAGPFQLQAAVAAVHDEAVRAEDTDWPEILTLDGMPDAFAPRLVVTPNRIVTHAMVDGPEAGLAALEQVAEDSVPARHHRTSRCGPLAGAGRRPAGARLALSRPEQRCLESRAAELLARTRHQIRNAAAPIADLDGAAQQGLA